MNSVEKQTVLHCLKSIIDEEVCEECPLYGTTGTDHCEKDCVRMAINALEQMSSVQPEQKIIINGDMSANNTQETLMLQAVQLAEKVGHFRDEVNAIIHNALFDYAGNDQVYAVLMRVRKQIRELSIKEGEE